MNYNTFDVEPKIKIDLHNNKKPYTLMNNVTYYTDKIKGELSYHISVNKGYNWDGASIPRIFWSLIGSKGEIEFLPASLIHDVLCERKDILIEHGVKVSSIIFRDLLIKYGVSPLKANIMAAAVRIWQYGQRGWK